ncbi:hypothetical protein T09_13505, partial [Trichinella sp. T9]
SVLWLQVFFYPTATTTTVGVAYCETDCSVNFSTTPTYVEMVDSASLNNNNHHNYKHKSKTVVSRKSVHHAQTDNNSEKRLGRKTRFLDPGTSSNSSPTATLSLKCLHTAVAALAQKILEKNGLFIIICNNWKWQTKVTNFCKTNFNFTSSASRIRWSAVSSVRHTYVVVSFSVFCFSPAFHNSIFHYIQQNNTLNSSCSNFEFGHFHATYFHDQLTLI